MQKSVKYYMNLPWSYRFEWDPRDSIYIAKVSEIKDCLSHGKTIEEAARNIKIDLEQHLEAMLKDDYHIPEPAKPEDYKGNIAYRTTPERHYKLAKRANSEGKSLSKLIDELIDDVA